MIKKLFILLITIFGTLPANALIIFNTDQVAQVISLMSGKFVGATICLQPKQAVNITSRAVTHVKRKMKTPPFLETEAVRLPLSKEHHAFELKKTYTLSHRNNSLIKDITWVQTPKLNFGKKLL